MNLLCASLKGLRPTALVHTMSMFLEAIENSGSHIENLKSKVIKAKKIQLHTGLEGFESPEAFGIYRNTGGSPLGVVGKVYEPANLELFLDAIQHSVLSSGIDLDLSKLQYKEYYGGSKVGFKLPYKTYEIKSPLVGDTLKTSIDFFTGFDGKTKATASFSALRLVCKNGMKAYQKEVELSVKNTFNNQGKILTFMNELIKVVEQTETYVSSLDRAVLKSIKQTDIDAFVSQVTGYDMAQYKEHTTRKRNILDKVNSAIATEIQSTGANMFSLLQGITRYSTHELAKGDEESILFGSASQMNATAHQLAFASLN